MFHDVKPSVSIANCLALKHPIIRNGSGDQLTELLSLHWPLLRAHGRVASYISSHVYAPVDNIPPFQFYDMIDIIQANL